MNGMSVRPAQLKADGEYHPFTADLVPAMIELLTAMAEGVEVLLLERQFRYPVLPNAPALGWRFDPGDIWFDQSGEEAFLWIHGRDRRITEGNSPDESFSAQRCNFPVPATPGRLFRIVDGWVEFQMHESTGTSLEICFRRPT